MLCSLFIDHAVLTLFIDYSDAQVRQAFTANVSEGKSLVVADYGQLELRILAHIASCR